ncbi:MAG: competence type IV pilus major pilin ComGC [Candidatus Omnitrophota bacterium]
MPNLSSKKAFTLVETMIVAAVLAVLATIALMTFVKARESAWVHLCKANQKAVYEAAVLYTLQEPDSLRNAGGRKARLDRLLDRGYIRNRNGFECPSSPTKDYDDYIIAFDGDDPVDVSCQLDDEAHEWP